MHPSSVGLQPCIVECCCCCCRLWWRIWCRGIEEVGQRCHGRILRESSEIRNYEFSEFIQLFLQVSSENDLFVETVSLSPRLFKNRWMTFDLQVKIWDCRVLVGPYPLCVKMLCALSLCDLQC